MRHETRHSYSQYWGRRWEAAKVLSTELDLAAIEIGSVQ